MPRSMIAERAMPLRFGEMGRAPPKQQARCVRWRATPGLLLLNLFRALNRSPILFAWRYGHLGTLRNLPIFNRPAPLAKITHSQHHGRSNALEDKHGVAYRRLFNKHVFWTKPMRFAGIKERQPIAIVRCSNFALRRDERTTLFLKPTRQAT